MKNKTAADQSVEQLETNEASAPTVPHKTGDLELKEILSGDVTTLDANDHLGCGVEESYDVSDEGKGSDIESEEEDEDCSDSSCEHSEGEDSDEEEEENQDEGEAETFWNLEQLEILKSAVPSFHFLPRTTVDKIVAELKVGNHLSKTRNILVNTLKVLEGCPDRVKYFARVWLERRGRWVAFDRSCSFLFIRNVSLDMDYYAASPCSGVNSSNARSCTVQNPSPNSTGRGKIDWR